ncbi:hypothetical protein [Streptomyces sp. NPDC002599]|uniref:hypothetical protein n=1 Tax=Streptomyces sp. NPDC002599 TaxID=3154421 RepID=UPI00332E9C64
MSTFSELNDDLFVREVLWRELPEGRSRIVELEEEQRRRAVEVKEDERRLAIDLGSEDIGDLHMYELASDVLVYGALERLLAAEEPDEELALRCSRVIELLLGSGRPGVTQMVSIRITDYLLGYIEPWLRFKEFAGPHLRAEVESRKQYYTGPF